MLTYACSGTRICLLCLSGSSSGTYSCLVCFFKLLQFTFSLRSHAHSPGCRIALACASCLTYWLQAEFERKEKIDGYEFGPLATFACPGCRRDVLVASVDISLKLMSVFQLLGPQPAQREVVQLRKSLEEVKEKFSIPRRVVNEFIFIDD